MTIAINRKTQAQIAPPRRTDPFQYTVYRVEIAARASLIAKNARLLSRSNWANDLEKIIQSLEAIDRYANESWCLLAEELEATPQ